MTTSCPADDLGCGSEAGAKVDAKLALMVKARGMPEVTSVPP